MPNILVQSESPELGWCFYKSRGISKVQDPWWADICLGVPWRTGDGCVLGKGTSSDPIYNSWKVRNFLWMICYWVEHEWSQFVIFFGTRYYLRINWNSGLTSCWSIEPVMAGVYKVLCPGSYSIMCGAPGYRNSRSIWAAQQQVSSQTTTKTLWF